MTSEQNLSFLVTNFKTIRELFLLALMALIILWIASRAGSAHFIRERIWRILGGSKAFQNEYLNKKWNEIKDLESINYKTGIKFKKLSDACKAFFWIEKHSISFSELAKSARYFDPDNTCLKNRRFKTREKIAVSITILMVSLLCALLLSANNFSEHAFLSVKKTNTRFVTDGISAEPWVGSSWHANLNSCRSGTTKIPDQYDKEVICSALSEENASFIQNTLELQKKATLYLFIILIVLIHINMKTIEEVRTAKRLYLRTHPNAT